MTRRRYLREGRYTDPATRDWPADPYREPIDNKPGPTLAGCLVSLIYIAVIMLLLWAGLWAVSLVLHAMGMLGYTLKRL